MRGPLITVSRSRPQSGSPIGIRRCLDPAADPPPRSAEDPRYGRPPTRSQRAERARAKTDRASSFTPPAGCPPGGRARAFSPDMNSPARGAEPSRTAVMDLLDEVAGHRAVVLPADERPDVVHEVLLDWGSRLATRASVLSQPTWESVVWRLGISKRCAAPVRTRAVPRARITRRGHLSGAGRSKKGSSLGPHRRYKGWVSRKKPRVPPFT
jgi:hypothetical protein